MKKILLVSLCLVLVASIAMAKNTGNSPGNLKFESELSRTQTQSSSDISLAPAQGTTTFLAYYTFDSGPACVAEGWTEHDITSQTGNYWHVSDFTTPPEDCGPGTFGGLVALEGSQSLWCGACPDPGPILCGYAVLPGYGNGWNQAWCTKTCLSVDTSVVVTADMAWDSEPGYDATTLEIDNCDDVWVTVDGGVGVWDGVGGGAGMTTTIDNGLHSGSIRIRYHFVSDGGWSDEDGLWDTDGAMIIDLLKVDDASGVVLAVENFEGEANGANASNDWITCNPIGYDDGNPAGELNPGIANLQEDPCVINFTCMWDFYQNSTYDYSCNTPVPAPGQLVIPYVNARDQYISSEVWSPEIPLTGSGAVMNLSFDVYRDLKLDALVFYVWHVRSTTAGCPDSWADRGFVYYGGGKDWLRSLFPVGDLLDLGAASDVAIALGVADMCGFWCGVYGTGACHSHAPLFDNVELYRVGLEGPQFAWRDIDEFHDNFSADGTITGTARIDCAQDVLPNSNPGILPGDSAVIQVTDPVSGLRGDANTGVGPAVYTYVRVDGGTYTPTAMEADDIRDGNKRWPYVGTILADGRLWHKFRHDTCFTSGGGLVADRYCIDLNDNLFVPGDTIWFFRGAENTGGIERYFSGGRDVIEDPGTFGSTGDIDEAAFEADELTILPAGGYENGGDILYVDGMNFRTAQWAWDDAFESMEMLDLVDRFDIRGPSSAVANHLASRVVDPTAQLALVYRKIIYNTGDLMTAFGDGSGTPDKSDDTGVLKTFLDNLPNISATLPSGGVWLNGDDVAEVWAGFTSASALALNFYLTYNVVSTNHVSAGHGVAPKVITTAAAGAPTDTMVAYGGCPLINDFDVLEPTGTAVSMIDYELGNSAMVAQFTLNPGGGIVALGITTFSLHYGRDDRAGEVLDRWRLVERTLIHLNNQPPPPIATGPETRENSLAQNYPNPFNPTTTIEYTIKEQAHVSLKVYNVAGQLVRTLVDEVQNPDQVTPVTWRGINNAGERVSSGVYFYKLVTKNFTQTKKMVLLK